MEQIRYPRLADHRTAHRTFIKQVQEILFRLKAEKHVSPSQLIEMISNWLFEHTLADDARIRDFLEEDEKKRLTDRRRSFEQERSGAADALKQITSLFGKETITEAQYLSRKSAILDALVQMEGKIPLDEIMERVALVESLSMQKLIAGEEERRYRLELFALVDLDAELAKRSSDRRKRSYLKSLFHKELISQERYHRLLADLTGCRSPDTGENDGGSVCLL